MRGMQRYSVQFEDRHGVWVHWRAFESENAAITECELIAARHLNSRVKDVLDWSGPAIAYREAHKGTVPPGSSER